MCMLSAGRVCMELVLWLILRQVYVHDDAEQAQCRRYVCERGGGEHLQMCI
jgi:hypothetical protein